MMCGGFYQREIISTAIRIWKYADLIYARTRSNGRGFPLENLTPLAEEIGLDGIKFKACLDSGKYAERVQADYREWAKIGITGTPANILLHNKTGETVLKSGAYPFKVFEMEIVRMLR